ncbi:MAG: cysteine desulfurase [Clostridia bacterium]|nr:cysteine desulfurase [Clostridia bacterium]MBR5991354.1 cysteine desulfurase [Clostridia bacterium]MBR6513125.1 cysteine desulfurase [Clostridia bacterium]
MECYFDNSATTKPTQAVVDAVVCALTENYGNPSSLHRVGDAASAKLEESRATVAKALGCMPEEVYFTSGGTESNNIAVMGTVNALRRRGNRIVTSCVEHPSVLECMKRLEEEGFEVIYLPVDKDCRVSKESLFESINDRTILVSLMLVNNEVGSVQPVRDAADAIKRAGAPALLHTDAVQAFGKLPFKASEIRADLITVSSHKIHGPKGAGALYVKKGTRLVPYVLGGGQENGLRSGTHGMPGIMGLAAAVSDLGDIAENGARVDALKSCLLNCLADQENLVVNSPEGFPYILNISLLGIPSEVLRNFLSESGVYVSTGSACSKGHRSYVLTAMGLDNKTIDSAIRVSFSRFNTKEETEYLAECLIKANKMLRKTN